MEPYWSVPQAALYSGDAGKCLRHLPSKSVHCVVTSPPYWNLRSYQSGADVKHLELGTERIHDCLGWATGKLCGECYVCHIVEVLSEVSRVLRDDGVMWLNLGDSYSSGGNGPGSGKQLTNKGSNMPPKSTHGVDPYNLVGIPWRVALALQASGWVLRAAMPWIKRSAMPDSASNRPGKATEDVFMFTKGKDYYFDMDAVRQVSTNPPGSGGACFGRVRDGDNAKASGANARYYARPDYSHRAFRNTDLWLQSLDTPHGLVSVDDNSDTIAIGVESLAGLDVTPSSAPGGTNKKLHFAVMPVKLVTPLILASTSEYGCCVGCGTPWRRVASKKTQRTRAKEMGDRASADADGVALTGVNDGLRGGFKERMSETAGWHKTCRCKTSEVVPCTVLDPFVGSGTTVSTAVELGRRGIGIDLSETYLSECAVPRIQAALSGDRPTSKKYVVSSDDRPPPPTRLRGI